MACQVLVRRHDCTIAAWLRKPSYDCDYNALTTSLIECLAETILPVHPGTYNLQTLWRWSQVESTGGLTPTCWLASNTSLSWNSLACISLALAAQQKWPRRRLNTRMPPKTACKGKLCKSLPCVCCSCHKYRNQARHISDLFFPSLLQ